MKIKKLLIVIIIGLLLASITFTRSLTVSAQQPKEIANVRLFEFATVRFMGERTSIVWPDGNVENVIETTNKAKSKGNHLPEGADYRIYWLTIAMNIMSKKGYDFVHMDGPDVVMKRSINN